MATATQNAREDLTAALREELRELALVGEGASVRRLRSQLQRLGPYFRTALLVGEPGSGREAAAYQLHALSPVAGGPFVLCAAADLAGDGFMALDAARHGTLYVEGLELLPLPLQARMVDRLQELDRAVRAKHVSTRLIAQSQVELRALAAAGQFRQDLYARLSVVEIRVTPLRERVEDIAALCETLLARHCARHGGAVRRLAAETLERLMAHGWPGNLEELREVIFAAACMAPTDEPWVAMHHLPALRGAERATPELALAPIVERLEDVLRRHVVDVLSRCAGNKVRAAELLGISRSTLYRMLDAVS